jgi:hypothetical protein
LFRRKFESSKRLHRTTQERSLRLFSGQEEANMVL